MLRNDPNQTFIEEATQLGSPDWLTALAYVLSGGASLPGPGFGMIKPGEGAFRQAVSNSVSPTNKIPNLQNAKMLQHPIRDLPMRQNRLQGTVGSDYHVLNKAMQNSADESTAQRMFNFAMDHLSRFMSKSQPGEVDTMTRLWNNVFDKYKPMN